MANYPNDQGNPAGAIPVYVVSGGGGAGVNGNNFSITAVITVTGTAVQLPAQVFKNGFTGFAFTAGSNQLSVGPSGVTNPQTVPIGGGSAVGTYLANGQGWSLAGNNSNIVYINGTAGDGIQIWGN